MAVCDETEKKGGISMRILILMTAVLALAGGLAEAQSPDSNDSMPTAEDVRRAVSDLPAGRVERPTYEALTPEQREYVEGILSGPRNAISGPLVVMLQSPLLGDLAQRTMAYARFAGTDGFGSVPPKLNELAVIMAAKAWSSPYVWNAHHRYAVRVGLPPALVEAVRTGSPPPTDLEPDVQAVYDFLDELITRKQVSDATFDAARAALGGDRQIVDLIGTFAIYQMSALLSAVDRTGLADGEEPTLRPLE
jgi:4-carboxymuconolactone decarboxylase